MTKKEFTNEVQRDHDDMVAWLTSIEINAKFLSELVKDKEELIFKSRFGDKTAYDLAKKVEELCSKALETHTDMAELTKGLIHSIDDDLEIKGRIGMFE